MKPDLDHLDRLHAKARIENLRAALASALYRLELVPEDRLTSIVAGMRVALEDDDKAAEDNR